YSAGTISGSSTSVVISVDVTGGSANAEEWAVKIGDYLEVQGGGLVHRITGVAGATPTPGNTTITLASALSFAITASTYYRIIRTPRIATDEILDMPDQVAIDVNTNTTYSNPLPISTDTAGNKYLDVLFGPGGDVATPGVTTASINLWVRDINRGLWDSSSHMFQGDPSIVAVYCRSGLIAAHPPCPDFNTATNLPTQPYKYVDDGRSK